jgi:hypothetical protein
LNQLPSASWVSASQSNAASASPSIPHTDSAIAASTWFHGSQWPPSNHGIRPLGCWTSAIVCALARTSDADSTPSTAGISTETDRSVMPR